jgi:hypothetical protein
MRLSSLVWLQIPNEVFSYLIDQKLHKGKWQYGYTKMNENVVSGAKYNVEWLEVGGQ